MLEQGSKLTDTSMVTLLPYTTSRRGGYRNSSLTSCRINFQKNFPRPEESLSATSLQIPCRVIDSRDLRGACPTGKINWLLLVEKNRKGNHYLRPMGRRAWLGTTLVGCDERRTLHNFRGRTIAPNHHARALRPAWRRGENEGLGVRGSVSQMHVYIPTQATPPFLTCSREPGTFLLSLQTFLKLIYAHRVYVYQHLPLQ